MQGMLKLRMNRLSVSLATLRSASKPTGRTPMFAQNIRSIASTSAGGKPIGDDVTLEKYLGKQLLEARKSKDLFKSNVLRTVIGELQTEQKLLAGTKQVSPEVLEETSMKSIRKAISKRRAAAVEYRGSQRIELAENEEREATYLDSLLPKEMEPEALREAVESTFEAFKSNGAFESASTTQERIQLVVNKINEEHGKGSARGGLIIATLMPLLQKGGFLKSGSKGKGQ